MSHHVRVTVSCPDRAGLLAGVASTLYELGGDLGDTAFAVLGEQAELACVCALPDDVSVEETERALADLAVLDGAEVHVRPFVLGATHGPTGTVTHRVKVRGQDRPGLMARMAEGFAEFGANLVRVDAERLPGGEGGSYFIRFEISVPEERAEACLANAANTAEHLGLRCETSAV